MKTNKPKILLLGKLPPPVFGPAIATQILVNSDLNKYYQLIHLDTRLNRSLDSMYCFRPVKLFKLFKLYLKMLYYMIKYKPDIVCVPISQSTPGFFKDSLFICLSNLFNSKTVIYLRGSQFKKWLASNPFLLRTLFIFSLRRCYGGIVLGKCLRYIFEDIFPSNRIFVVPNGGNFIFPKVHSKRNKFNITYLSNIKASKGILDVIHSALLSQKLMPHAFNFRILGHWKDGYLEKACKRFCTQNQLSVHFHNDISKEQKTLYLSNSDIFLFPPREPEGHPWVIIEAMAAGLPIITTDQGAITESVFHEQNGFIVQPSRPDQIVKYLIELYTNPKKCKAMGEYSYKLYKKHFTEEKMVEHLVNVFKDILDESPDKMPIKINPNHQKEWSKLRCNNSFKI